MHPATIKYQKKTDAQITTGFWWNWSFTGQKMPKHKNPTTQHKAVVNSK